MLNFSKRQLRVTPAGGVLNHLLVHKLDETIHPSFIYPNRRSVNVTKKDANVYCRWGNPNWFLLVAAIIWRENRFLLCEPEKMRRTAKQISMPRFLASDKRRQPSGLIGTEETIASTEAKKKQRPSSWLLVSFLARSIVSLYVPRMYDRHFPRTKHRESNCLYN